MLQRYVVHLILIFLFAFTQIGVAAHEISHLNDSTQHSQQHPKSQSKHASAEQCSQCISYAKVANGLALSDFLIPEFNAGITAVPAYALTSFTNTTNAYTARAPPQSANA